MALAARDSIRPAVDYLRAAAMLLDILKQTQGTGEEELYGEVSRGAQNAAIALFFQGFHAPVLVVCSSTEGTWSISSRSDFDNMCAFSPRSERLPTVFSRGHYWIPLWLSRQRCSYWLPVERLAHQVQISVTAKPQAD